MYECFNFLDAPFSRQRWEDRPVSMEDSWNRLSDGIPPRDARPEYGLKIIDEQIRAANNMGLGVMLCVDWRVPLWAAHPAGDSAYLPGRTPTSPHDNAPRRTPASTDRKAANERFPMSVTTGSQWGWFIAHLCARYMRNQPVNPSGPRINQPGRNFGNPFGAWIDQLEFCNETNLMPWPANEAICSTVEMFKTAEAYGTYHGVSIMGPGTADVVNNTNEYGIKFSEFTQGVVGTLRNWRPRNSVSWSHHIYHDVAGDKTSRYEAVRTLLIDNGWYDRTFRIWVTEGGFNVGETGPGIPPPNEVPQRDLIRRNWDRMQYLSDIYEAYGQPGAVYAYGQHTFQELPERRSESFSLRRPPDVATGQEIERLAYAMWRDLPGNPTVR